ncbi:MAG: hypothetical protein OHK0019_35020 [Saprospiraceae bacterium]
MKNVITLFIICFLLTYSLFSQEDSCRGNTWIKLLGQQGTYERGTSLCPSGDGNLYVTGSKPDSAIILKINPDGEILWSRSFDFYPGYDDITHLSLDSDGMLLGIVISSPFFNGSNYSCYFKYDSQQDKLVWAWRPGFYTAYAGLWSIHEKCPGGNYFTIFSSIVPPNENVIIEIDRQTGQEIPYSSWRYEWNGGEGQHFVLHDSTIYTLYNPFNTNFQRLGLLSISALNGLPKWWQVSHLPQTDSARIDGEDLLVDDDAIVSVSSGNDQGFEFTKRFVFLQKTTSNGDIVWIKKYDLLEFPAEKATEIVRVSDGYVVFGGTETNPFDNLFVLKTDFDGNVLWARRFDYSTRDAIVLKKQQNEFLEMDGFLYFTAHSRDSSGATDWVIAKLDSEGRVGDSCAYLTPTPVETYSILDPVQEQPPLSFRNLDIEFCSPVPVKGTSPADVSGYRTICENICTPEEGCDVKINGCVKFELLSIALDADGNRHYRVRFTNACAGQTLNYVAIQLPDGVMAVEPNDGAVVSTETGGDYLVRNPNYSPFYSVRFRSQGGGIGAGASEVFEYALPPQAQPAYINVMARFQSGQSYETHLNVFNCPVQQAVGNRADDDFATQISLSPNPVTDLLTVTLPEAGAGNWQIFSSDGRAAGAGRWQASAHFTVPTAGLPSGIYYLHLLWDDSGRLEKGRFVKIK